MTEMKPVVTEHAKAGDLPERFRQGLDGNVLVRVTVEPEAVQPTAGDWSELYGSAKGAFATSVESTTFVRALRDEWDE